MKVSVCIVLLFLFVGVQGSYLNQYGSYRHQPISKDNYCLNGGPISFRPRYGKSIPNCLPAPGPVIKQKFVNINILKPVPYHCPRNSYVCGYSRLPMDIHGNVKVKCCTAVGVTYDERECVRYFRVESPNYPSPTKSGYFLVGSTPLFLPKNQVGFYNKECLFQNARY
uniref:Uncharacterized protein n=1 Tax=Magallana gigas TaxID=29159 RepID=A0A8W8NWM7_MAGGI|nr:uncharacterized protein LOC105343512 isoform X1 [Crassostrea gigas]